MTPRGALPLPELCAQAWNVAGVPVWFSCPRPASRRPRCPFRPTRRARPGRDRPPTAESSRGSTPAPGPETPSAARGPNRSNGLRRAPGGRRAGRATRPTVLRADPIPVLPPTNGPAPRGGSVSNNAFQIRRRSWVCTERISPAARGPPAAGRTPLRRRCGPPIAVLARGSGSRKHPFPFQRSPRLHTTGPAATPQGIDKPRRLAREVGQRTPAHLRVRVDRRADGLRRVGLGKPLHDDLLWCHATRRGRRDSAC